MEKVKQGDSIQPKAADWNAFIDATEAVQKQQRPTIKPPKATPRNTNVVKVQNVSGAAIDRFRAVAVTGVVQSPLSGDTDDTDPTTIEFTNNAVLTVNLPTAAAVGKWLVLCQPLQDQEIGLAVALGVTPVWTTITAVGDTAVDCVAATSIPASGSSGYDLIWVAGGVGTATGTGAQYAVIRMGGSSSGGLPRLLVRITTNASGGGKYNGRIMTAPSSDVSASGDLVAADFGNYPGADNCLVLNATEIGQSTHDLTDSYNPIREFVGTLVHTNSTGLKVVAINGFWWESCDV